MELRFLELSHPAWPEPLRLVHDWRDWTVTLEDGVTSATFKAAQFRTTPPRMSADGVVERGLQVDIVSGALLDLLREVATSAQKVSCVFREYASDDLSGPEGAPEYTTLRNISVQWPTLSATARGRDVVNAGFPALRWTTDNAPGLKGRGA